MARVGQLGEPSRGAGGPGHGDGRAGQGGDGFEGGQGQQREHAVVFYAVDPAQPCGTEQGWRLSDNGNVGYTQAYANDGSGNYSMMNIDGVNSVASRND